MDQTAKRLQVGARLPLMADTRRRRLMAALMHGTIQPRPEEMIRKGTSGGRGMLTWGRQADE